MEATGLITEYNPFHNGHIYHIATAKKLYPESVIIVLMSGNWVQRGKPSIIDKWEKARIALKSGADLVFELPYFYSVQPGQIFANGAIALLNDLKVNNLVFGSEHPKTNFIDLARKISKEKTSPEFKRKNETFAKNFSTVLKRKTGFELNQANDILAFSYARSVLKMGLENKLHLKPIKRAKANNQQKGLKFENKIASSKDIRIALEKGKDVSAYTPLKNLKFFDYEPEFFDLLKYRLYTDGIGQIRSVYQVNEGIDFLVKHAIQQGPLNLEEFIALIKSKRYTFARLRRVLNYILLNIKVDQMNDAMKNPYHRLLGFNSVGRKYLHNNKKSFSFPVFSHLNYKNVNKYLNIDYKAGLVYNQIMDLHDPQDIKRPPLEV